MIDRNAFFFWGTEPLSWVRYMSFYSFRKLNPDWNIYLYITQIKNPTTIPWETGEYQDFVQYKGNDYKNKLNDLNIKIINWDYKYTVKDSNKMSSSVESDIFRWNHLINNSGFYFDNDILFIKPMDEIYNQMKEYDIILCFTEHFSLGCIGSSGKDIKLFKDLLEHAINSYTYTNYQSMGPSSIRKISNNNFNTLLSKYSEYKFYNHAFENFYPFKFNETKKIFEEQHNINNNTIGIHWFAGDSTSQKYNTILNENTYQTYNSTFTNEIKKIYE